MRTFKVLVWDSVTQETSEHVVRLDISITRDTCTDFEATVAKMIHEALCEQTGEGVGDWSYSASFCTMDQPLLMTAAYTSNFTRPHLKPALSTETIVEIE